MLNLNAVDSRGFDLFGMYVNWYGVIIAVGMALGILLAIKLFKKRNLTTSTVIDIALVAIPSAIIGARLYYVIFYGGYDNFLDIFKIWEGGLAIYGGVIGGFIGILIYCLIKKVSLIDICDATVPCLILGQAIGRWGNFTNNEAYGTLITNPKMQWFPFSVLIPSNNYTPEAMDAVISHFGTLMPEAWFAATFFYESIANFITLALLLVIFKKTNIKGLTTCGYFTFYGVARFFIEGLRMDSLYLGTLRVSQWLSLILVAGAVGFAVYLIMRDRKLKMASAGAGAENESESIESAKNNTYDTVNQGSVVSENESITSENQSDDTATNEIVDNGQNKGKK